MTAVRMAGSLKGRLDCERKSTKRILLHPEPKEGCYGKKKKKMMSRLIQTRGKKKEEKDKEGEINEEQEDKDNKVEDNN